MLVRQSGPAHWGPATPRCLTVSTAGLCIIAHHHVSLYYRSAPRVSVLSLEVAENVSYLAAAALHAAAAVDLLLPGGRAVLAQQVHAGKRRRLLALQHHPHLHVRSLHYRSVTRESLLSLSETCFSIVAPDVHEREIHRARLKTVVTHLILTRDARTPQRARIPVPTHAQGARTPHTSIPRPDTRTHTHCAHKPHSIYPPHTHTHAYLIHTHPHAHPSHPRTFHPRTHA